MFNSTSKNVSWNPNWFRFKNNRANARKPNVHLKSFDNYFHANEVCVATNFERQCCRAMHDAIRRMKTISKSVHIWLVVMGEKPTKISTINGQFWHKNHIFRDLKLRGAIKTGGWVGFRDEEWLADTKYAKMESFEIGQTTKFGSPLWIFDRKTATRTSKTTKTTNDTRWQRWEQDSKRYQQTTTTSTRSERTRSVSPRRQPPRTNGGARQWIDKH